MWLKRVEGAKTETLVLPDVKKEGGKIVFVGHGRGIPTTLGEPFEVPDESGDYMLSQKDDKRFARTAAPTKQATAAKKAADEEE